LAEDYARGLLRDYFQTDCTGYVYSGAVFDTYPAAPASGLIAPIGTADQITDSDLVALSMLGIRITGYEALIIMQDRRNDIEALLADIPPDAHIEEDASAALLAPCGPAWTLWELLREIKDRTKEARFGAVAAGKLLARKRPSLIPIEDSRIAGVFSRTSPDRDKQWWDDVRSAALDSQPVAAGPPCGATSPASGTRPNKIICRSCAFSTSSDGCTHITTEPDSAASSQAADTSSGDLSYLDPLHHAQQCRGSGKHSPSRRSGAGLNWLAFLPSPARTVDLLHHCAPVLIAGPMYSRGGET
jgi:hypothetical protein